MVLQKILFGFSFVAAIVSCSFTFLVLATIPYNISSHSKFKKLQSKLPFRYNIRSSNPVFHIQFSQAICASLMTIFGVEISKDAHTSFTCRSLVVVFGAVFGFSQFLGYVFLLIKAMTIDAQWRKSTLREALKSTSAFLSMYAFIIPRSAAGVLNSSGECSIKIKPRVAIVLLVGASVLDIILRVQFTKLFNEPLMEIVATQFNYGDDGKQRAVKAYRLIRNATFNSVVAAVMVCTGYGLVAMGLFLPQIYLPYLGAYFVTLAHMIPSFLSTRKAWVSKLNKKDDNQTASQFKEISSARGLAGKFKRRNSESKNNKDDEPSSSQSAAAPRGPTLGGIPKIDLGVAEIPIMEEDERKVVTSGGTTSTANSSEAKPAVLMTTPMAVGRGGYAGVQSELPQTKIKVDIKLATSSSKQVLEIESLEKVVRKRKVKPDRAQEENSTIMARGSTPHQTGKKLIDTYVDPVFVDNGGGISRGGAKAVYKDDEPNSTHSDQKEASSLEVSTVSRPSHLRVNSNGGENFNRSQSQIAIAISALENFPRDSEAENPPEEKKSIDPLELISNVSDPSRKI
jgi:hypothetical protein